MSDSPPPGRTDDVVRDLRRALPARDAGLPAGGADAGRHRRRGGARALRRRLAAVTLCAVLVAALGVRGCTAHRRADVRAGADVATARTWSDVLVRLDAARTAAFAGSTEVPLASADLAGSAADRADRAAVRALAARGVHASGYRTQVRTVAVVSTGAERAVLHVVDRRPAYTLTTVAGAEVERVPERGEAVWQVALRRTDRGWRVESVRGLSP